MKSWKWVYDLVKTYIPTQMSLWSYHRREVTPSKVYQSFRTKIIIKLEKEIRLRGSLKHYQSGCCKLIKLKSTLLCPCRGIFRDMFNWNNNRHRPRYRKCLLYITCLLPLYFGAIVTNFTIILNYESGNLLDWLQLKDNILN